MEGHCIQRHRNVPDKDKAAHYFNRVMLQGKVHATLQHLSSRSSVLNSKDCSDIVWLPILHALKHIVEQTLCQKCD